MRKTMLNLLGLGLVPLAAAAESPKEGTNFENGLKTQMVWVAPGSFRREGVEVKLTSGFWLGATEVTQEQWDRVMRDNPSKFKGEKNLPVESLTWEDAVQFCEKLTKRERAGKRLPEGHEYRLPTEAQWEYACRAGTEGDFAGELEEMAWYEQNSGGKTHPVGKKKTNGWGLYDMHGNVSEWCSDWHAEYDSGTSVCDPTGPKIGSKQIARGGNWSNPPEPCASGARRAETPPYRTHGVGFRVILTRIEVSSK